MPHAPPASAPRDAATAAPAPTPPRAQASPAGAHGRVLALQRSVGNQAVTALLRRPAPPPPAVSAAGGGPVIQRAVGFEFETGWLVWDQRARRQWAATNGQARYEPEPPARLPLRKKDRVYAGEGFRVEADEAANDESELEFVVDPPVPATAAGREDLFARMAYMTLMGARLLRAAGQAGGGEFTLDAATGTGTDDRYIIRPADDDLTAGPQVTAGISLERVARIATTGGLPRPLANTQPVAQAVNLKMADQYLPQQIWPMTAELKGFLTVIAPYLWSGERAVLYPKQITDSFLLSRTDFAALFGLLPQADRTYLARYPIALMQLALAAAGLETDALDVPVIQRVWTNENYEAVRTVGPTRRLWLTRITQGIDLLSSKHYRELQGYYEDSPTEATLGEDLESLGELGGKTEKVGTAQRDAGIFEFRSAGASRRRIPLLDWEPFTDEMMRYLIALEG